jgi:hypothetical protein
MVLVHDNKRIEMLAWGTYRKASTYFRICSCRIIIDLGV